MIFLVNTGSSQVFSDLSMSSLHPSESLGSVVNSYQQPQKSSITDLDETVKSTPIKRTQVNRDMQERFDEGVFDDGAGSQTEEDENNSNDSDDEDEIEHFDTTDCIMTNTDNNQLQQTNDNSLDNSKNTENGQKNSSNTSMDPQVVNLGKQ